MRLGVYSGTLPVNYDEDAQEFDIAEVRISLNMLIECDKASQIAWASDDDRRWVWSLWTPAHPQSRYHFVGRLKH